MGALQPRIFNGVSRGAFVAAIPSRRLHITYTKKKEEDHPTACSCWREPLGEGRLLLRGDRVSVHPNYLVTVGTECTFFLLVFCSAARGCGYSMIHTLSYTHILTLPHICTHSYTYQTQTTRPHTRASHGLHKIGGTGCDMMEPPTMPNSIADAICCRQGDRSIGGTSDFDLVPSP